MDDHVSWLYPGSRAEAPVSDADLAGSVEAKVRQSIETKQAMLAHTGVLVDMAKALTRVFERGGRLLTMGNGGSSCDAAHLAVEFNHPVTVGRRALPALHLGADLPMTTAVGNDVGFREVYARQVISWGTDRDALVGLSTSGNSENLLAAYEVAKRSGLVTLGFAGHDGGRMQSSGLVDHLLVIPSHSVHRIQESHLVAYHVLWDLVHTLMPKEKAP
ncbi:MAG: SIS domain-containing protein [Myxococcota bacterium]